MQEAAETARGGAVLGFSYSDCFFCLTSAASQAGNNFLMTKATSKMPPAATPAQTGGGKGKPATEPQPQKPQTGRQPDFKDGSAESSLELPSDRDQAADMTGGQIDPVIKQAAKDLKKGLEDTSKAIEADRTYKKL